MSSWESKRCPGQQAKWPSKCVENCVGPRKRKPSGPVLIRRYLIRVKQFTWQGFQGTQVKHCTFEAQLVGSTFRKMDGANRISLHYRAECLAVCVCCLRPGSNCALHDHDEKLLLFKSWCHDVRHDLRTVITPRDRFSWSIVSLKTQPHSQRFFPSCGICNVNKSPLLFWIHSNVT